MSDLDLDALEAVAQAATPGEWRMWDGWGPTSDGLMGVERFGPDSGERVFVHDEQRDLYASREDWEFMALSSPPTVLALIAELRDSRARIAALEAERDEWRLGISQSRDAAVAIYRARAEAAEQKVAALAEVIEQVLNPESGDGKRCAHGLSENVSCNRCRDNAIAARVLRAALAAAPTPPDEGPRLADRDAVLRAADDVADRDAALLDRLAGNPTPPTEAEPIRVPVADFVQRALDAHPTPPTPPRPPPTPRRRPKHEHPDLFLRLVVWRTVPGLRGHPDRRTARGGRGDEQRGGAMSELDPALVEKAARVLFADYASQYDVSGNDVSEFDDLARAVLDAVTPAIREAALNEVWALVHDADYPAGAIYDIEMLIRRERKGQADGC